MKREEYRAWRAADAELKVRLAALRDCSPEPGPPDELMAAYRREFSNRRRRWIRFAIPVAAAAALVLGLWWKPSPGRQAPLPAPRAERTTEFIPVRYGASLAPNEQVQILRVRVPRGELRRLGLPVAMEASAETVKADVVIGEDGMVEAIRFVY